MPVGDQTRTPPPGSGQLTNTHIVLYCPFKPNRREIQKLLTSLGATVSEKVTYCTTYLVCDEQKLKSPAKQVIEARKKNAVLVKPAWLAAVIKFKDNPRDNLFPNPKDCPEDYLWDAVGKHKIANTEPVALGSAKESIATCEKSKTHIADINSKTSTKQKSNIDNLCDGTVASDSMDKSLKGNSAKKPSSKAVDKLLVAGHTKEPTPKAGVATNCQVAVKKHIIVPLDDQCTLQGYTVYVDQVSGDIYDASLNLCNASKNNNKLYRLQILFKGNHYQTWTRWGRVGSNGQTDTLGTGSLDDALKHFESKFKEKSGRVWGDRTGEAVPKKYVFVERDYEGMNGNDNGRSANKARSNNSHKEPECTHPVEVQSVLKLIFNRDHFKATMSSLNYDANKQPLGKLHQSTILRAFIQLQHLADLMDDPGLADSKWNMSPEDAREHLSNMYCSLVPHVFGRNCPPTLNTQEHLEMEVELLKSLSNMKEANKVMSIRLTKPINQLDSYFNSLSLEEMSPLAHSSQEFDLLTQYLIRSKGSSHSISYTVQNIFRIRRRGEERRLQNFKLGKVMRDRRLLWHGSRCTNFSGILNQGLRIAPPEAPVSGYMFGKGIYLADTSSKSANYCCPETSNGEALLLLCEAELGNPLQKLRVASFDAGKTAKQTGRHSTLGIGKVGRRKWMDARDVHHGLEGVLMPSLEDSVDEFKNGHTTLQYNEYICYDTAQVSLRYLFHVKM